MAWKETERSKAVKVRRIYRCTDCKTEFAWIHDSEEEDAPECPICAVAEPVAGAPAPTPVVWQPPLPAITGAKSRAIDYTQAMVEQQFGLTDFNDNQRVGDIAYKPPPPLHAAEAQAMAREMIQAGIPEETTKQIADAASNFWQGTLGGQTTEQTLGQQGVASQASAAARAMGVDPIGILEADRKQASMRVGKGYTVAASVKG